MPLITKDIKSKTLKHPRESGVTFDIVPLTTEQMLQAKDADKSVAENIKATHALIGFAVTAWSYETEISPEAIKTLDSFTAQWLFLTIIQANAFDPDEVKNSEASSGDTSTAEAPAAGQ